MKEYPLAWQYPITGGNDIWKVLVQKGIRKHSTLAKFKLQFTHQPCWNCFQCREAVIAAANTRRQCLITSRLSFHGVVCRFCTQLAPEQSSRHFKIICHPHLQLTCMWSKSVTPSFGRFEAVTKISFRPVIRFTVKHGCRRWRSTEENKSFAAHLTQKIVKDLLDKYCFLRLTRRFSTTIIWHLPPSGSFTRTFSEVFFAFF